MKFVRWVMENPNNEQLYRDFAAELTGMVHKLSDIVENAHSLDVSEVRNTIEREMNIIKAVANTLDRKLAPCNWSE